VSGNVGSMSSVLAKHRRIAFDANALIYLTETAGPRADVAAQVLDEALAAGIEVGLSVVALSELLVGPARSGDGAAFERLAAGIEELGFRVVPADAGVAKDAAWIRGVTGMSLPDAYQVACALRFGATLLVTNDRDIRSRNKLDVVYLDDFLDAA
jgi:predicted nucleic acid-binding protein